MSVLHKLSRYMNSYFCMGEGQFEDKLCFMHIHYMHHIFQRIQQKMNCTVGIQILNMFGIWTVKCDRFGNIWLSSHNLNSKGILRHAYGWPVIFIFFTDLCCSRIAQNTCFAARRRRCWGWATLQSNICQAKGN